jgi:hypothetical protein
MVLIRFRHAGRPGRKDGDEPPIPNHLQRSSVVSRPARTSGAIDLFDLLSRMLNRNWTVPSRFL